MTDDDERRHGRREILRRALVVLAAVPAVSLVGCGGSDGGGIECGPSSLSAEQQRARQMLHYVDHGPSAERHCVRCRLYTGNASACGTCSAIAGPIHPEGTCDAFVANG